MRRCNGSQTDQGEVLNDCCHVTSASVASAPKVTLLQIFKILLKIFFITILIL